MIKAVFIDIDDTLLSFEGYVREAMQSGFEAFGIGPYQEEMLSVFHRVNSALWRRLEEGSLSFEELKKNRWNQVFSALGFQADGVKFEAYFRDRLFDSAIPEEGAIALLEHLKGKYILCAASNGPYRQQVNRLKIGGMLGFFDHLFISEEIGHSKPSREFFDVAFSRLHQGGGLILPEEAVIIGDSISSDLAGGIGYGLKTVFYNPQSKKIPPEIRADFTVKTLNEITRIL